MANIQLTDNFALNEDVKLASFCSLLKYFQQIPAIRLNNGALSKMGGLTLDDPAVTSVSLGLSLDKKIPIGPDSTTVCITAEVDGSLELVRRTPTATSLPGGAEIAEGTCAVGFCVQGTVGASVTAAPGMLQFGIAPQEKISLKCYQCFPVKTTLLEAARQTIGNFIIPAAASDLESIPDGCITTVSGTGSLKLSVTANLWSATNPLASVSLPGPLPSVSFGAGGSVKVGASLQISCTFDVCARKAAPGHVRLDWSRNKSAAFDVSASVSEGVSASFGGTDLFSSVLSAISSDPAADINELQKAGLPKDQITAIQSAVQNAVARNLQLAVCAQLSTTESEGIAFQYDIELAALTPDSRRALDEALRGDLTALHAGALPGITEVQSVWSKAHKRGLQLQVNMLGILNYSSISSLTLSGSVLFEPASGSLVITDTATAQRIVSTSVNFGADTDKLRHVMAECFLLSAAYQGTQQQVGAPSLKCSQSFFDLEDHTSADLMAQHLRIGTALGLLSAADATLPAGIQNFGRTTVYANAAYDNDLAVSLFLDPGGAPISVEYYERAGRLAIQLLVSETDQDAMRRKPAIDDDLWNQMKSRGQPSFVSLFPGVSEPVLGAITADYSAIRWWADAMSGAGRRLSAIKKWFAQHPSAPASDPEFQTLRQELAAHMKDVAGKTKALFGEPWGLIAMDGASNRRAAASILIAGPKLVRSAQRALASSAGSSAGSH